MRGTSSREKAVIFRSRILLIASRLFAAFMNPITIVPSASWSMSVTVGGWTRSTIRAPSSKPARSDTIFAPAAANMVSG